MTKLIADLEENKLIRDCEGPRRSLILLVAKTRQEKLYEYYSLLLQDLYQLSAFK